MPRADGRFEPCPIDTAVNVGPAQRMRRRTLRFPVDAQRMRETSESKRCDEKR